MPAGRYSAGRIFLQVVPSFKGFQREVDREVKKANAGMAASLEKDAGEGGRKAGKKAGGEFLMGFTEWTTADQARLQKTFGKILINLDKMNKAKAAKAEKDRETEAARLEKQAAKDLKAAEKWAQKGAEAIRKAKVAGLKEQNADAERFARESRKLWESANAKAEKAEKARTKAHKRELAIREANEAKSARRRGGYARDAIEKAISGIDKNLGEKGFGRAFDTELEHVRKKALQVRRELSDGLIDTKKGRQEIAALGRELERIGRRNPGMDVGDRANIRNAIRDTKELGDTLQHAGRRGGGFRDMLRGTTRDGEDGANAFRIFNYRILGLASILPMIVPLLAVTAAGIVALGTALIGAAAGAGVMILAFSGIFAAVKALGDVQDNAAKDQLAASKTMRNAAKGVRDSQQSLAQARVQAARAAEDSSRRVADAERRLADTQKDATKAQNDLRAARKAAQDDQDALADRIKAGALDERQALIDLFNAQVAYNAVMASGGSTNLEKEQASIDLGRAQLAIKQIRDENADLAAEQKKTVAQGVDGDEKVVAAKEKVADSNQAIKDAEQDVADARRDQARTAADSARSIRDAQERVTDAQVAYQEALTSTGEIGSGSMQKLETAMGKLSPAGRAFALYLHGLRDDFQELRAIAQEGLLPGVQESMDILFKRYGPGFANFVGKMARELSGFFVHAAKVLTSPVWEDFFSMMDRNGPLFAGAFGEIFLDIATGFAGIMTAFEPFTVDFVNGMLSVTQAFADWGASLKDNEGFQSFLAYIIETGPKVWEFFKQFGGALVAIGVAMAPIAGVVLDAFTRLFEYIADMDPDMLAAIVTGILGFVIASQSASGAVVLLKSLMTPFHSVFGAVVFILIAAGAALIYLYQHNEKFRESVQKVFKWIDDNKTMLLQMLGWLATMAGAFFLITKVIMPLIGVFRAVASVIGFVITNFGAIRVAIGALMGPVGIVIAIITALGLLFIWLWNNNETFKNGVLAAWAWIQEAASFMWNKVLKPVFSAIGTIVVWLWEHIFKPYFGFIFGVYRTLWEVVSWVWSLIGPIFELFGAAVSTLWNNFIGPIFGWIGDRFSELGDAIGVVWRTYIEPVLDQFGLGADDLRGMWATAIDAIGNLWHGLIEMIKAPLRFIVETVINRGFVDNFNTLADYFGTSHIDHLKLSFLNDSPPKAPTSLNGKHVNAGLFATGGYTGPGAKYQPAGIVHADEYVIRKESTNKIRGKYGLGVLDYVNRYGELPGMGGYANGGLVAFGKLLQSKGFRVSENPAFGGVHGTHSRTGWHYRGGAIDVNWPNGQRQSAEETAKLNAIVGLARQYGLRTLWQWKGHYDHAHFDIDKGPDLGNFAGAGGGRSADLPWWIEKPFEFLKDKVEGFFEKIPGGKTPLGKLLTHMPSKLLDFAKDKIAELINGNGGDYGDTGDGGAFGGGIEQWRDEVVSALGRVGQPTRLADVVLRRMNQESSGNPRAINLWDSNARAGTPSKGLMQVIDPTFATWRDRRLPNDIYNPMSNIVASMRYAINRYGSLENAYNRTGGYAEGGLVTEGGGGGIPDNGTMMYDNGGYLPPGITQVVNLTGRPEPVFTAGQFEGMKAGGGSGRGALIGNLTQNLNGSDITANDVVGELMYQVERVNHGGKYAGRAN